MTKAMLLDMIRGERRMLEMLLAPLGEGQLTTPGVMGDWTIKDVIAHLAAWDGRLATWLEAIARGETPEMPEPGLTWEHIDYLNDRGYQENRDRSLAEVMADSEDAYCRVIEAVEALLEADLLDPDRFPWMDGKALWRRVRFTTYRHYAEHIEDLRAWAGERAGA
jgi:hypothetical protein